jgi:hypothetical protein
MPSTDKHPIHLTCTELVIELDHARPKDMAIPSTIYKVAPSSVGDSIEAVRIPP